jgi:hypothetical protein
MNMQLISMCGDYCGQCDYREQMNCPTCQVAKGEMFWGKCGVAKCCTEKGLTHCGLCDDLPCDILKAAFNHPEHGDKGERLANLEAWGRGEETFIKIGTYSRGN